MATSATPRRPRTTPRAPASDRGRLEGEGVREQLDDQYDLLTATLIGLAIGVGTTLLMRRGPSGGRPISPLMRNAARGAKWAGVNAARLGKRGAVWARDAGEDLWESIPREEIRDHVREYLGKAQDAIDDVVESEVRDLRKALKRQRRRLGI